MSCSVPCLNFFRESLISKNLFLFENFSCESHFKFNCSLFINYTTLRSAIIDEEFLSVDHNCFSFFYITHEPTIEIWIKVSRFQVIISLVFMSICLIILLICLPNRSDSQYLHSFRCRGINLNFSSGTNFSKERSSIFNVEFVFIEFENLILVDIKIWILLNEWFNIAIHDDGS